MGGFFGVVSASNCVREVFYGTDYHSHLGTRRGGMAVQTEDGSIRRRIHDITNSQFKTKLEPILSECSGKCAIGIISDVEDQPLLVSSRLGTYAIVTVGKIENIRELAEESYRTGTFFSEMSGGELNPTEMIASLINQKPDIIQGIQHAMDSIKGSCSLLIMIDGKIIAARDKYGRTPVSLAKRNEDGAVGVAMETSAFPNLDFTFLRDLGPGEIVQLSVNAIRQLKKPGTLNQICSFFWVYFGYPSSNFEGINTESSRYRNGRTIAEGDDYEDIDSICGIPDSGVAHAIGYSNASGKPYQRALVKYTPTWPRSFTPQNQAARNLVARMKLIPVEEQIRDKRLLFLDDSIVRGTQFKDIARRLYERGAKAVHLRSASPPIMFPCKFLNFSRSRSTLDLAAPRAVELLEGHPVEDPELLKKYTTEGTEQYNAMVEVIRKELGLATLKYQTLEKLIAAIGLPKERLCTYCYDGCDPTSGECPACRKIKESLGKSKGAKGTKEKKA
ncbi:MAG: amidophosphoribosyltransferase [Lentisphaeria bacterium]|nr:amidophosphoribosyltransferase [Lentisphaeria bacterium]